VLDWSPLGVSMRADTSRDRLAHPAAPAADTVWLWRCGWFALVALFIGYAGGVEVR
jgi:hypothetical protein